MYSPFRPRPPSEEQTIVGRYYPSGNADPSSINRAIDFVAFRDKGGDSSMRFLGSRRIIQYDVLDRIARCLYGRIYDILLENHSVLLRYLPDPDGLSTCTDMLRSLFGLGDETVEHIMKDCFEADGTLFHPEPFVQINRYCHGENHGR